MGGPLNFLKNVKNFGKKILGGISQGLSTAGRVMNTIAPVVNTVGSLIPGKGTTIAAGFNKVNEIVNNGAEITGKLSKEGGVRTALKDISSEKVSEVISKVHDTTKNMMEKIRKPIQKGISKPKMPPKIGWKGIPKLKTPIDITEIHPNVNNQLHETKPITTKRTDTPTVTSMKPEILKKREEDFKSEMKEENKKQKPKSEFKPIDTKGFVKEGVSPPKQDQPAFLNNILN